MNPYELLGDDDASVEQLSKKVASQATVSKPAPAAAAAAAPKTSGALKGFETGAGELSAMSARVRGRERTRAVLSWSWIEEQVLAKRRGGGGADVEADFRSTSSFLMGDDDETLPGRPPPPLFFFANHSLSLYPSNDTNHHSRRCGR